MHRKNMASRKILTKVNPQVLGVKSCVIIAAKGVGIKSKMLKTLA